MPPRRKAQTPEERIARRRQVGAASVSRIVDGLQAPAPAGDPDTVEGHEPGVLTEQNATRIGDSKRWQSRRMEADVQQPPVSVERSLGGLVVQVYSRTGGKFHQVAVAECGSMHVEVRRRGEVVKDKAVPVAPSAFCRTCRSFDCVGAKYGLEILDRYTVLPAGHVERYEQ